MFKVTLAPFNQSSTPRLCTVETAEEVAKTLLKLPELASDITVELQGLSDMERPESCAMLPWQLHFDVKPADLNDPVHITAFAAQASREFRTHAEGYVWFVNLTSRSLHRVEAPKPAEKKK